MTTPDSLAGLQTFDTLNITYELTYHNNPFKKTCISNAISLLPLHARVLDVGCGTGIPVSQMLSNAGLEVHGFDISPKMIAYAQSRVNGSFTVSDMLSYQPSATFNGIFVIFSQLQLSYASLHSTLHRLSQFLEADGLLVLGTMPGDDHVTSPSDWDESGTYAEDYPAPFMGEMLPTLMLSRQGQRDFLTSMGLETVSETIDMFHPDDERCVPEEQQYIIAKRPGSKMLVEPKPLPKGRG